MIPEVYCAAMKMLLVLVSLALLSAQQRGYSPIQDGDPHGDPPYLLEDGWEPLLNGKDLSGWKACDATAKSEWFTATAVRFERILGPTQLHGRSGPGGTLLNGPTVITTLWLLVSATESRGDFRPAR